MTTKSNLLHERAYVWTDDGKRHITHQLDSVHQVKLIVDTMHELMHSKETLFHAKHTQRSRVVRCSKLGRELLSCMQADLKAIDAHFPSHRHSPLYTLFKRYIGRLIPLVSCQHLTDADASLLNRAVEKIRAFAKTGSLQRRLGNLKRCERGNARTSKNLLKKLRTRYSKLLVVRLDLGYFSEYCPGKGLLGQRIQLEEVQKHRNNFLDLLRRGPLSKYLAGYIWKMEYGPEKGYHFHFALFFNGQAVCRDINIGDWLGNLWRHEVTMGKGMYYNCNKNKEAYRHCGIGMVSRGDGEKWPALEQAIRYLTKVDLYIRFRTPGRLRTFGVGGPYGGVQH